MSESPKFFVPGVPSQDVGAFLHSIASEEQIEVALPFFCIMFNFECRFYTVNVGDPHPFYPDDSNDLVRLILKKQSTYKIFVRTARHFEIDSVRVLDTIKFS